MANTIVVKSTYQDGVASGLKGTSAAVRAETGVMGSSFSGLGSKIESGFKSVASGVGGALSHLKNTIGGLLTGPLGLLGLGAGLFGVSAALKSGIDTSLSLADSLRSLTGVTHDSAESLSALVAVANKYGIATDQIVTLAAFAEKTIGKLSETFSKGKDPVSKLTALDQQYGISLVDAKGNAVDFETELNRVADYYNSNATAAQKAALAAQLFGRGYVALIPILQLGSKGLKDAETAAANLGLTLTATNVKDLAKYQETMETLGEAAKGLQLQLSLALIPALTDVATAATKFIADNKAGIIGFFKTLIADAQTAAGFLTGTIIPDLKSLASAAIGFWDSIPAGLRDVLTKTFVADRAIKFLLGFDPLELGLKVGASFLTSIAGKLGGGIVSSLASAGIGKAFVQPVFVTNPGFGGLAGGAAGAAGEAGAAAGAGEAAAGTGVLETITGAGFMALVAPLAVAAVVPLAINALLNSDPSKIAALALKGRQATAAARGLNPTGVATDYNGPKSSALPPGVSFQNYGNATGTGTPAPWDASKVSMTVNALSAIKEDSVASVRIGDALLKEEEQAHAHQLAEDARGRGALAHSFLLALRSGDAKVVISDFPKELAYLSTASADQKKSGVYLQGLRDDEAALKKAMVNATGEQKVKLSADLVKLQALIKDTTAAIAAAGAATVSAVRRLPGGKFAAASGVIGHTTGPTNIGGGVMGEAGGETFAILSHPRSIPTQQQAQVMPQFIPIPVPMSWTPGQQQSWAQQAGPAMARWMQQMGLLPKLGATVR